MLMTTHYMDEAEELAHRIAIMDRGKMIAEGAADELKSMLGMDVVYIPLDNSNNADICEALDFVKGCKHVTHYEVKLVVDKASKALPEIFSAVDRLGIRVREVSYRRPTLNKVFLHLTGRELRDALESNPILHRIRRW